MKKLAIGLSILVMSTSLFAANNLCKNLTGTWAGTYNDPTNLFQAGNFPISLQLKYAKGMVYGYTLPANDSAAGKFGSDQGAYFFVAKCNKNTLSDVYFVKNTNPVCGDPSTQKFKLMNRTTMSNLILPYENAMINANLRANLTKQSQASATDSNLLTQAQNAYNAKINTCH